MRRVDREKRHLRKYCPMDRELCMGDACKWSVGGKCAVALLASEVADARGGATVDGGEPEGTEVDR